MTLNEYQKQAMTTCMESSNNFAYMMLNLVGEVGEFIGKTPLGPLDDDIVEIMINIYTISKKAGELAKDIRKHPENHRLLTPDDPEDEAETQKEAGDILWQLFGLISVMGWNAEDIAQQNLEKLASRQERNVIDGDGDNR